MSKPRLTIGMPHYEDFDGAWFTVQSLCLYHPEIMKDVEIIIVNDSGDTATGRALQGFLMRAQGQKFHSAKFINHPKSLGPALSKNDVFLNAAADAVLCCDCHVLFPPGEIERLVEWFEVFAKDSNDLYCGPNVLDDFQTIQTEMREMWRGQNWGIWHNNPAGNHIDNPPYEIWGNGCGVMACRKFAWLGFNPHMRGFGGEEGYIHEKFRKFGRKAINLPWLRWIHRYQRPTGPNFPLLKEVKIRNLLLGFQELSLDVQQIYNHFVSMSHFVEGIDDPMESLKKHLNEEHSVDPKRFRRPDGSAASYDELQQIHRGQKISEENWRYLLEDPINHFSPDDLASKDPKKVEKADRPEVLKRVLTTERDLNKHLPKLMEFAEKVESIEEITRRFESSVALLSTDPSKIRIRMYGPDADERSVGQLNYIAAASTDLNIETAPDFNPEWDIEECDLLFYKCKHNEHDFESHIQRWLPKVKRFIILHDTVAHAEKWEDDKGVGLKPGMQAILNAGWFVCYHADSQWGFTVFGCQEQDKPEHTIHAWNPGFGPGTELKAMLDACGVEEKIDCTCKDTRNAMDRMGVEECRKNREQMVKIITDNSAKWRWHEKLTAAAKLATSKEWVLAWRLDLNDIYGSLYDIAIERAIAKEILKKEAV